MLSFPLLLNRISILYANSLIISYQILITSLNVSRSGAFVRRGISVASVNEGRTPVTAPPAVLTLRGVSLSVQTRSSASVRMTGPDIHVRYENLIHYHHIYNNAKLKHEFQQKKV